MKKFLALALVVASVGLVGCGSTPDNELNYGNTEVKAKDNSRPTYRGGSATDTSAISVKTKDGSEVQVTDVKKVDTETTYELK